MARPKLGSRPQHIEYERRLYALEMMMRRELTSCTDKWMRVTLMRDIKSIVVERAKIMSAYESGKEFYLRSLRIESMAAAKAIAQPDVPALSAEKRMAFWDELAEAAVARKLVEAAEEVDDDLGEPTSNE